MEVLVFFRFMEFAKKTECRLVTKSLPGYWNIKTPSYWTEADIMMAKALICKGYSSVRSCVFERNTIAIKKNGKCMKIPDSFFESLELGETIDLSEIVGND